MKVIQINFVADQGSTGKIATCIEDELLQRGEESLICYGRKNTSVTDRRYKFGSECEAACTKIANKLGWLMYGGAPFATRKLIIHIQEEQPDIVHLHCLNGYCVNIYSLLKFLAKAKIRTVVTHHAEFLYTGSCPHALECTQFMDKTGCLRCPKPKYATGALFIDRSSVAWNKMQDAFQAFDKDKLIFTAVSPWVKKRSGLSRIVKGYPCEVVENGLDESVFCLTENRKAIRKRIPGCKRKMILHVTASFDDCKDSFKGGDKIIELARQLPDVTFVVACSFSQTHATLPPNVCLWGRTKDQKELAELYNAADLTIITSKRETFSMIVAESLCCGTPIVGFKAGGPETITLPDYSTFVDYGNMDLLLNATKDFLSKDFNPHEISSGAHKKFASKLMADKYINVYNKLLQQ